MENITRSELEVLKTLWRKPEGAISPEICEMVMTCNDWDINTVKSILSKLVQKGVVARRGERRSYIYMAAIAEDEYKLEVGRQLTEDVFDADTGKMLCFFAQNGALNADDVAELKKIIESINDK